MVVFTIGHGRRSADELFACLTEMRVRTLVDVRRFPGSRRNPQHNGPALAERAAAAGIAYRHAEALGGLRSGEAGEERFACVRPAALASYAARMTLPEWQRALSSELGQPEPLCLLCAETRWQDCHRRLIAELLMARRTRVEHLLRPGEREPHVPSRHAEHRGDALYLCGEPVA